MYVPEPIIRGMSNCATLILGPRVGVGRRVSYALGCGAGLQCCLAVDWCGEWSHRESLLCKSACGRCVWRSTVFLQASRIKACQDRLFAVYSMCASWNVVSQ